MQYQMSKSKVYSSPERGNDGWLARFRVWRPLGRDSRSGRGGPARRLLLLGAAGLALLGAARPATAAETTYELNGPTRFGTGGGVYRGVDVATGAFLYRQHLTTLAGVIPLSADLIFNSQDDTTGPFGKGTSWTYDYQLQRSTAWPGQPYVLIAPGNRHYVFDATPNGNGEYVNTRDPEMLGATLRVNLSLTPPYLVKFKSGEQLWFDGSGLLSRLQDRHGVVIAANRTNGALISVSQGVLGPRYVKFYYDGPGPYVTRVAVKFASPSWTRIFSLAYDASNRLSTITAPDSTVTRLNWTTYTRSDGKVLPLISSIVNPRGITAATLQYDGSGRVTRLTTPDGGYFTAAYSAAIGSNGTTTVTTAGSNSRSWDFTWNPYKHGYLTTRTVNEMGEATTFERSAAPSYLVTAATDFRSRRTSLGWDVAKGNLTSVTRPTVSGGTVTWSMAYDPAWSQVTSTTDPLNRQALFTVDPATGDITAVRDPENHTTSFVHNSSGQVTSATNALNQTTTYNWGINGTLASVIDAANHQTSYAYDSWDHPTSVTDANNKVVRFTWSWDRLASIQQTLGATTLTTSFSYDPNGNRTSVIDANNHTWQTVFDSMDRVCEAKNPLLQSTTWSFDLDGNVQTATDAMGQRAEISYTTGFRPAAFTFRRTDGSIESTIGMTWNPATHLLDSCADSLSGTCSWTYDSLDRMTAQTTAMGTINYTLDDLSRRIGMLVPGQGGIAYGFNNNDQITSITQNTQISTFTYDQVGRLSQQTLPTGVGTEVSTQRTWDAAGYLSSLTSKRGSTIIDSRGYTRDATGRLTQENDNGLLCNYGRDDLYRMTSANDRTGTYAWTYDNAGNRLSQTLNGTPTAYTVNAANQVTAVGGTAVARDTNGNVTGFSTPGYAWDVRGRLHSVSQSGYSGQFAYDPFNHRVSQTVNGTTTNFLLDVARCVSEISGATTVPTLYGPGSQVLSRYARWFTPDSRGSTSRITDSTGSVVQSYAYGVFGQSLPSSQEANPIQFLGGMNDNNGLQYLGGGGGYFSPQIGQSLGGGYALVARSLLKPVGDFLGGIGHCLGNAALGAAQGIATAGNPLVQAAQTVATVQGFAQDVHDKGLTLAVLDPVTDALQQLGDWSSPHAIGNSLCNDALLGLAADGVVNVVKGTGTYNPGNSLSTPTVGQTVWRVHGGDSLPMGRYWTPIDPRTVPNYRSAAGLPNGNTGVHLSEGVLTDVTGINVNPATALDGNPGGLLEYDLDPWTQLKDIYTVDVNPPF